MSDVTSQNFAQEVIETSRQVPVLVDFWAPWCGPCRTLGPMLEKLEHEYAGKWKLAKVNSDESPELSAHFNVRSIPHVVAFVDGKPVDQFVGVLPESQLRGFLDRVIPQPAEVAYREGLAAHQANALAHAREAFQNALAYDPGFDAARFALIDLLLDTGDVRAAQNEFALLSSRAPQDERHAPLQTRLEAAEHAGALPDADALHRRIAAAPDDLQARLDLAQQYIARQDYEAALEQLLAIVERDRAFRDDIGRKTMVSVFDLMRDPQAVSLWRRQLASRLN
ncbi:thioredoxin [Ralstonia pseudosolanacearum]|uniref:Thioredoxin n=2 Tax=Ralstonia solanacearum species complex TaxID=3116862 RepID=A0A0K1ZMA7_RALSL|nr:MULTISPECIES: thioredoxin [Ralstonia]AKZ27215.1 thioredoxin [Ralstonia solanacearum]ARS55338.1 thioredoxin [Ralstonia solanacearum FJAT-91]ESS48595.1 thioredoxin protein [Ralstonia solanacearum SD54]AOE88916.1 Protein disulfide-isomerase A3 [Ralstonia solanacearum]ARU22502.1 GALA protein [Ralstonia solanacearum]